jgi:cytochrome c-type biogenesis protein CcmH/NrfG
MAAVYSRLGDAGTALAEYQKAVSLQPKNPQTWLGLGEYELTDTRDWRGALANLERAQQLDHAIGDYTIDCARQALQTGRVSAACSAL